VLERSEEEKRTRVGIRGTRITGGRSKRSSVVSKRGRREGGNTIDRNGVMFLMGKLQETESQSYNFWWGLMDHAPS